MTQLNNYAILFIYIFVKLFGNPLWQAIDPNLSYLFDIFFIIMAYFLLKKRVPKFNFKMNCQNLTLDLSVPFLSGVCTIILAGKLEIASPFMLDQLYVVFLLLIVAPILEELMFRYALWEAFANLCRNRWVRYFVSGLLFSAAHFVAYFSFPEYIHRFIIYQSVYTFILGFYCAYRRDESESLMNPMLAHFAYNLGFGLMSF